MALPGHQFLHIISYCCHECVDFVSRLAFQVILEHPVVQFQMRDQPFDARACPFLPYALTKMNKITRVERKPVLEVDLSAEVLPIRILYPPFDYSLISHVIDLFQQQKSDYRPDRNGGPAYFRITWGQVLFKLIPANLSSQLAERFKHYSKFIFLPCRSLTQLGFR
jgi:hypothetical protein